MGRGIQGLDGCRSRMQWAGPVTLAIALLGPRPAADAGPIIIDGCEGALDPAFKPPVGRGASQQACTFDYRGTCFAPPGRVPAQSQPIVSRVVNRAGNSEFPDVWPSYSATQGQFTLISSVVEPIPADVQPYTNIFIAEGLGIEKFASEVLDETHAKLAPAAAALLRAGDENAFFELCGNNYVTQAYPQVRGGYSSRPRPLDMMHGEQRSWLDNLEVRTLLPRLASASPGKLNQARERVAHGEWLASNLLQRARTRANLYAVAATCRPPLKPAPSGPSLAARAWGLFDVLWQGNSGLSKYLPSNMRPSVESCVRALAQPGSKPIGFTGPPTCDVAGERTEEDFEYEVARAIWGGQCASPEERAPPFARNVSGRSLASANLVVGQGFFPSRIAGADVCLSGLRTREPSFAASPVFVHLDHTNGTIPGLKEAVERWDPMASRPLVPQNGVYTHRKFFGTAITADGMTFDESQATLTPSAAGLLASGDVRGFYERCGSHFVHSIARRGVSVTLVTYQSRQSESVFEYELERTLRRLSQDRGAKSAIQNLRIETRFFELGALDKESINVSDVATYRKRIAAVMKVSIATDDLYPVQIEVTPWTEFLPFLTELPAAVGGVAVAAKSSTNKPAAAWSSANPTQPSRPRVLQWLTLTFNGAFLGEMELAACAAGHSQRQWLGVEACASAMVRAGLSTTEYPNIAVCQPVIERLATLPRSISPGCQRVIDL